MTPAKGYTEMKDSGIEWVGKIPAYWEMAPLKRTIIARDSGAWGEEPIGGECDCICMRIADFDFDKGRFKDISQEDLTQRHYSPSQLEKLALQKGDLLIEKSGGGEKTPVGRAVLFDKPFPALFANFMDRIRVNNTVVTAEYMEYWWRAMYYRAVTFMYIKQTTGLQNLNVTGILSEEKIAYPTCDEQSFITSYLDTQCAKIDEIIAQAKASIEDYKQWKASIIYEAVTKGLDPNVEMKDSGIEWIGKMPKHWQDINPKALFSQRKERANPGDRQLTASQQFGVIYQDEYMELTGTKVVTVEKDFDILKHVSDGDFVISMRSFQGGLEYSTKSGSISSAYVMLVPNLKLVYPRYYRWLLKSNGYIRALQSTSDLVRDGQAMRYSNFAKVRLITLPLGEQEQIANYLDTQCAKIDKLMTEKQSLIDDLESYKKSLIYEVVTGKRRVC